jgi:hypothetical protein
MSQGDMGMLSLDVRGSEKVLPNGSERAFSLDAGEEPPVFADALGCAKRECQCAQRGGAGPRTDRREIFELGVPAQGDVRRNEAALYRIEHKADGLDQLSSG